MGKVALLASGAVGLGAIAVTLKSGISEWMQSEKVAAQTGAVLKSTGGIANVTAGQVDTLATALMNKTGIDDEAIKSGENWLLTFKNVRNEAGANNDIFTQATKTTLDLAVAQANAKGGAVNLGTASNMLGKALNDPIKGMTALGKAGVTFTDAQKEAIKKLVETGHLLEAQKMILKEVKSQVEGSAEAYGKTLPGQLNILKENFNNLAGSIVSGLQPALSGALVHLNKFVSDLSAAKGFTAKIGVVFDVAKDAFTAVRKQIQQLLFGGSSGRAGAGFGGMTVQINQGLVSKVRDAFANLNWTSVGKSVIDGLTNALKSAGNLAKQLASTITKAIDAINWVEVGKIMGPGLTAAMVTAFVTLLDPAFWVHNWELALSVLLVAFGGTFGRAGGKLALLLRRPFEDAVLATAGVIARVSPKLAEAVMVGLQKLPRLIGAFFGRIGATLEGFVRSLFGRLGGLAWFTIKVLGIDVAIHALEAFATGPAWDAIQTAFATVESVATATWAAIVAGVSSFGTTIAAAMTAAWDAVRAAMVTVLTTLQTAATTAWNTITAGVSTFGSGLVSAMTTAWNAVRTATTTVLTTITAAVTTAFTTMRAGVTTGMTAIGTAMTTAWSAVSTATTTALTTLSAAVTTAFTTMRTGVTTGMTAISTAMTTAWNAIKTAAAAVWNFVVGAITGAIGRATTAAVAVGHGIVTGIGQGLSTIFAVVKGGLDAIWGIISGVARSAANAAKAIGSAIIGGVVSGLAGMARSVGEKIYNEAKGAFDWARGKLGIGSPSTAAMIAIGKPIGEGIVLGATEAVKILGSGLVKAITASFATVKGAAVKGMNDVGRLIVAAAKKYGVDARAALAVAMGEGGIKFGAVGDSGHAFGPFQMNNAGGVLTGMDSAAASKYANSVEGINAALRGMAAAGAAGKVGLAAITAIISKWERPRDVAASITAAAAAYKTLGPQIASAVAGGAPAITAAQLKTLTGLKNLVVQYTPIIGREHALGIIRGLVATTPTLLQNAKAQMVAAAAAARQAVVDAKGAFVSAFNDMATGALAAFDAKMSAWKPPSLAAKARMELEDQIKQMTDGLGPAVEAAETTLAAAFAKGNAAAIAQAQADLNTALASAQTQIAADAASKVSAAQAALAAAQATGDQGQIDAAQAALDQAIAEQTAAVAKGLADQRALVEQNLTFRADAEQRTHDAVVAKQREGLAAQLADLKAWLAKHPEEWQKMGAAVQNVLSFWNVRLTSAGTKWADSFASGVRAGIPAAVAAAQALAAAVAAVMPVSSPAKKGPLAVDIYEVGKRWAGDFSRGIAAGGIGNIIGSMTFAPARGGGMAAAGAGGGGMVVNVTVQGALLGTSVPEVAETIRRELYRVKGRNGGLNF